MSRIFFILGLLATMAINASAQAEGEDESFPRDPNSLPGRNVTVKQQCQERKPDYFIAFCSVDDNAELCADLKCSAGRGDIQEGESTGPALDGTWCGDGKMCLNESCVEDPEPSVEAPDMTDAISCEFPEADDEN